MAAAGLARNPRIEARLRTLLERACRLFWVPEPALCVSIEPRVKVGGALGQFIAPPRPYSPIIFVFNPDRLTRDGTLMHEFTHYLDWLDGVRQADGTQHDVGFWERLWAVEEALR